MRGSTTRVWRVIEAHVERERAKKDYSGVARVGMDETSAAKGHDYVSVFIDMDARKVLFATEGKDVVTVEASAQDPAAHGGAPQAGAQDSPCRITSGAGGGAGAPLASRLSRGARGAPPR